MEVNEYVTSEKQVSFFRFQDLRVYGKTIDFVGWINNDMESFPGREQNWLGKKLLESGNNIALYLAEGSARNKQQFIYYLKMARTSLRECVVYLDIAEKTGYIPDIQKAAGIQQLMELTRMLGAMANSINKMTDDD